MVVELLLLSACVSIQDSPDGGRHKGVCLSDSSGGCWLPEGNEGFQWQLGGI